MDVIDASWRFDGDPVDGLTSRATAPEARVSTKLPTRNRFLGRKVCPWSVCRQRSVRCKGHASPHAHAEVDVRTGNLVPRVPNGENAPFERWAGSEGLQL